MCHALFRESEEKTLELIKLDTWSKDGEIWVVDASIL
jgi:hypothetical protein